MNLQNLNLVQAVCLTRLKPWRDRAAVVGAVLLVLAGLRRAGRRHIHAGKGGELERKIPA